MSHPLRVLIVDDDPTTSLILAHFLQARQVQVQTTTDPRAAAQLLRENSYDFLISDLIMPEVSGIELLIWCRQHVPQTRVLLMTGFPSEELEHMALEMGAVQFFAKPVNPALLARELLSQPVPALSGSIQQIRLFDLLQVLCLAPSRHLIGLEDSLQQLKGRVWMDAGTVVHASSQQGALHLEGEDALYLLSQIENGQFNQLPWQDPPTQSIEQPLTALLFNIAQRIDEDASALASPGTQQAAPVRQRILIVDDDPTTLSILERLLQQQGWEVQTAYSGAEALYLLQTEVFEVLLSDVQMPDFDGLSLLVWARGQRPHLRVLLMTGTPLESYHELAQSVRGLKFLTKPIQPAELQASLAAPPPASGYRGEIRQIQLLDLVQMYLLGRQQVVLEIGNTETRERGKLYLSSGQLLHAEWGSLRGEAAFYALAATRSGLFSEQPWSLPAQESLRDVSINRLMLKASQAAQQPQSSQLEIAPELLSTIEAKLALVKS
ncbi:MAG: response regulator [Candidatus Sericytochromatia bacterium]